MSLIKTLTDKHHRMERFSVMFISLIVCMAIVVGLCFKASLDSQSVTLGSTALYTTTATTSKSGVSGSVLNVYTSDDGTKSFIMVKFDDMSELSLNASNYSMYLTGAAVQGNDTDVDDSISGSLYIFGSTGYVGIYLVDASGFDSQILDLVVRLNSTLTTSTSDTYEYDQFRIYFNPGASGASSLDCLNGDTTPSISDFYNEIVIQPQEEELHEELEAQLEEMYVALETIAEYEERLVSEGIVVPDEPDSIAGDTVVANDDGTYSYYPATILAGGYDLDWQNTSIIDGFLDDLIAESDDPTMTVDEYLTMMSTEISLDSSSSGFNTNRFTWQLTDGTLIDDLSGTSASRYTEYNELCEDLVSAWRSYYLLKVEYQRTLLGELIELEVTKDTVLTSANINSDSDVLSIY